MPRISSHVVAACSLERYTWLFSSSAAPWLSPTANVLRLSSTCALCWDTYQENSPSTPDGAVSGCSPATVEYGLTTVSPSHASAPTQDTAFAPYVSASTDSTSPANRVSPSHDSVTGPPRSLTES